jgi:hypothetical protein
MEIDTPQKGYGSIHIFNFKDSTTMMTTTYTTVFKRMGRILSLVFSDYNKARAFREAFLHLVIYTVLFIIGYRLNLVFDNVPDGRIFDGYAMAALFCGLSVLSGFMNNMICIGGCLTMLIFMVIKLAVSMAIGIIALPICIAINLYRIVKMGAVLVKSSF